MSVIAPIEFGEIALATGVRLRYADVGPRSGSPVLLLHGRSSSPSPILSTSSSYVGSR